MDHEPAGCPVGQRVDLGAELDLRELVAGFALVREHLGVGVDDERAGARAALLQREEAADAHGDGHDADGGDEGRVGRAGEHAGKHGADTTEQGRNAEQDVDPVDGPCGLEAKSARPDLVHARQ